MENELVQKKPISSINKNITRLLARSEAGIFLATVFVIIIIRLRDHTFLSTFNIISILNYASYTGIIAVPLVFLLVSKLFDMSIGRRCIWGSYTKGMGCRHTGLCISCRCSRKQKNCVLWTRSERLCNGSCKVCS